ncbi:hypothetical protein BU17DRAFT_43282, partial [Hysterangium stoloniferum]
YIIDTLTMNIIKRESIGWIGSTNKELLQVTVALWFQNGWTTITMVKGHSDASDALADSVTLKMIPDMLNLCIPESIHTHGICLQYAMQALVYHGILGQREPTANTLKHVVADQVHFEIDDWMNWRSTHGKVWLSIWKKHVSRNI